MVHASGDPGGGVTANLLSFYSMSGLLCQAAIPGAVRQGRRLPIGRASTKVNTKAFRGRGRSQPRKPLLLKANS